MYLLRQNFSKALLIKYQVETQHQHLLVRGSGQGDLRVRQDQPESGEQASGQEDLRTYRTGSLRGYATIGPGYTVRMNRNC